MPHILIGQMLMVLLITKLADVSRMTYKSAMIYGILGLSGGIIFPPMLIILFTYLFVLTSFTGLDILSLRITFAEKIKKIREFIRSGAGKIIIFAAISLPSLIYLQLGLREQPWKALGLFDIEHRFIMPYKDIQNSRKAWKRWYFKHKNIRIKNHRIQAIAKYYNPKRKVCSIKNCSILGERHHPDYNKPKEIIWLCKKHHEKIHQKYITCTIKNCFNIHRARGLCANHWRKWKRGTL